MRTNNDDILDNDDLLLEERMTSYKHMMQLEEIKPKQLYKLHYEYPDKRFSPDDHKCHTFDDVNPAWMLKKDEYIEAYSIEEALEKCSQVKQDLEAARKYLGDPTVNDITITITQFDRAKIKTRY